MSTIETTAVTGVEQTAEAKSQLATDLVTIGLVFLHVGIMYLDFYSHPHQGVADLERRQILIDHLGQLAKHIGNYGFSAAAAMAAIFLKYGIDRISDNEVVKKINKRSFQLFIAGLITLNGLIEYFPNNHEMFGDAFAGLIGIGLGVLTTQLVLKKYDRARQRAKML